MIGTMKAVVLSKCGGFDAVEMIGGLDILINSAAVGITGPVALVDLAEIQAMMDVNARGPFVAAQAAIPHLPKGGRIISIGSALAERVTFPGVTACAMSKSAPLSFTRGLARELGPQGMTLKLALPRSTDTQADPADGAGADFQRRLSSIARHAEPSEIASAVVFLAGPAPNMVTGSALTVDGGANA